MKRSYSGRSYRKPYAKRRAVAAAATVYAAPRPNVEFKSIDTDLSTVINNAGAIALLNGCSRGDEISQRNGRETTMKSIWFRANLFATSATGLGQIARLLLVYDRQPNAAALTVADVLTAATIYAPRNLDNRKRFKIFMDQTFVLPSRITATVSGTEQVVANFYRKLRHPVVYNSGDAGTVADITTGSLYLVVVGSGAPGATAGGLLGSCRVRFTDQ